MAAVTTASRPSRRTVVTAAAWSAPVVAIAAAAPAATASTNPLADYTWYWSQFQVGTAADRVGQASTQVNIENRGTSVVPFTATIVIHYEAFRDPDLTDPIGTANQTFTQHYAGTSGEASDPLLETIEFTPTQLPPPGQTVYVRFTLVSMTATPDSGGSPFNIPRDTAISQPNPSVGQGYVSSF